MSIEESTAAQTILSSLKNLQLNTAGMEGIKIPKIDECLSANLSKSGLQMEASLYGACLKIKKAIEDPPSVDLLLEVVKEINALRASNALKALVGVDPGLARRCSELELSPQGEVLFGEPLVKLITGHSASTLISNLKKDGGAASKRGGRFYPNYGGPSRHNPYWRN